MWIWFALAAVALIGEVATGTFYLLLVALGIAAGGVAAMLGWTLQWQLVAAIVVALAGLFVLRAVGVLKKRGVHTGRNVDANLDIGQTVEVEHWSADRAARVFYRGANWQAQLAEGESLEPGTFVINEIKGTRLILVPKRRSSP
ncbi:NfeD family protein [Schauerella aestuarii]|uniref:NfeD family protein n=1 Tax=Schauerella aestuarii TaxID=2511204 RepID=UPI00136B821F|nr:NfeD family protein [Achromobacter aestuarii]MYZ44837.1 NfeD family protein [Achromobacter aestuarii]